MTRTPAVPGVAPPNSDPQSDDRSAKTSDEGTGEEAASRGSKCPGLKSPGPKGPGSDRLARNAAALRANLARRKAQSRQRAVDGTPDAPLNPTDDDEDRPCP